jgi:hypothetical protein
VTPEKIVRALDTKRRGDPRFGPKSFPKIAWPEPLKVPPPWEGGDGNADQRHTEEAPGRGADATAKVKS